MAPSPGYCLLALDAPGAGGPAKGSSMQRRVGLVLFVGALVVGGCGGGDDTTAAGSTDTNFSGKDSGDFCQKARDFEENTQSTGDSSTPDGARAQFNRLTKAVDDLVDSAPGEIKADAESVGNYFGKVNDLYKKYDYDASKIPEEESNKLDTNDAEVKASSDRVESYFEKVCKIDSDGDGDTDGVQQDVPDAQPAPAEEPPDTSAPG